MTIIILSHANLSSTSLLHLDFTFERKNSFIIPSGVALWECVTPSRSNNGHSCCLMSAYGWLCLAITMFACCCYCTVLNIGCLFCMVYSVFIQWYEGEELWCSLKDWCTEMKCWNMWLIEDSLGIFFLFFWGYNHASTNPTSGVRSFIGWKESA